MERGDFYLVSLDPTAGHEQQGKRPVLVISAILRASTHVHTACASHRVALCSAGANARQPRKFCAIEPAAIAD
jgi:mRNA-degrading endonuclease toxin of MazEF toxin-antitoxin module